METVLEDRIVYCRVCDGEGATWFSVLDMGVGAEQKKFACPYCDGKGLWGIQRVEVAL